MRELSRITDDALFAEICTRIILANTTSKMTERNRFADIEPRLIELLRADPPARVHDVAVSSGITAVELHAALSRQFPNVVLDISDKFGAVSVSRGFPCRVFDLDGDFLFGYAGPFYCDPRLRPTKFISLLLGRLIRASREQAARLPVDRTALFDPSTSALIRANRIAAIDYDLFRTEIDGRYDLVRCMNILNIGYFPADMLRQGIRNVTRSVRENGLLLIGRNQAINVGTHATLFRKVGGVLRVVEDFNGGSEVRDVALSSGHAS
ncbi:MAG: hypothetical protein V4550_01590 [Gemmatimonadota bacterium]